MLKTILALILLIILLWFFLRLLERGAIYYPNKNIESTPQDAGLLYEDIYFKTNDNIQLNAWYVPIKDETKRKHVPTILFFHGNAGNISHRIEVLNIFNNSNYNIFIFDYRGFGRSKGRPSEKGTYLDALAAYNYLISREDIDTNKIVLYGKSLGGAIAVDLATKVKHYGHHAETGTPMPHDETGTSQLTPRNETGTSQHHAPCRNRDLSTNAGTPMKRLGLLSSRLTPIASASSSAKSAEAHPHCQGDTQGRIHLRRRVKIYALITESCLSSTVAVAKEVYPILPVGLLLTQKFDALSKIDKVTVPKLIMHSMDDEIVSFSQGEKLFNKAKEPKEFMLTRGGHNSSFFTYTADYMKKIDEFLKKIDTKP